MTTPMTKDSPQYRAFRTAVHGWAFASDNGLKARIKAGEAAMELNTDATEQRQAAYTLAAMKESL